MRVEIRIAGLGGQGVVLAGQILGKAAIFEGFNAVQTQSYGAEARGSAAKSEVIIADDRIWYPYVRKCDILIALSQEALNKYIKDLKENGMLIVDSVHVKELPSKVEAKVFSVPFSKIAKGSGKGNCRKRSREIQRFRSQGVRNRLQPLICNFP